VATVAVGEGMNENQTMMKPDGDLIGRKSPVFEPIACIAQLRGECLANLVMQYAGILLRRSVETRPFPRLIKHPMVQISKVWLSHRVIPAKRTWVQRPIIGKTNVGAFPFVPFISCREIRNKVGLFVG
jgi:hypothetical protein